MSHEKYYISFGPEWIKEMSKRKTKELLELLEVKPFFHLSKTQLIQLYRSQCIRDQFNDMNRVGARIKWRDAANKHERFISCKVEAGAEILDGKAMAYFDDGTFKCIEPEFLGTSIYRRLLQDFANNLIELAPKYHVEINETELIEGDDMMVLVLGTLDDLWHLNEDARKKTYES